MTSDDGPSTTDGPQRALRSVPSSNLDSPRASRPAANLARRTRLAASRRRPWWKWALIGLLLAFSLATTGLYAAALIRDLSQQHWGAALDASRDAVPAAVAWAALSLLFSPRSSAAAERLLSADDRALTEKLQQAATDQARMETAQRKVERLTEKLASLMTAGEHAHAADLEREVAETTARLDQATQWLAGARTAVAVSQRAVAAAEERLLADFPDRGRRPDPAASKPA